MHMKQASAIAAVVLSVLLFSLSIVAATPNNFNLSIQNNLDRTQQFTSFAPVTLSISNPQSSLNQSTRADIYSYVENNPGIHFRGLCDNLGLSIGRAQYHTGILVSAGFLTVYSDGKIKRFFVRGKYSLAKMKIISVLRHQTRGDILKIISERKTVSHSELASKLDITSQGLTWQMNQLEKEAIVKETNDGLRLIYSIKESDVSLLSEMAKQIK
jgi:predicted transcriptional regulator